MDRRPPAHDAVADDLPAYVLDVLDPDERAHVAAHVATCPCCRDEQRRLELTVGALGTAVPQVNPATAVRRRLLAALETPGRCPPVMPAARRS